MNDPYKVLGVPRNATADEVKAAYRELAKKYHPDNYADNPLADLASEKMKEINEAYDTIEKSRSGGQSASSSYTNDDTNYNGYQSSNFRQVRDMINSNNLEQAQKVLDAVELKSRSAEWYFLQGSIMFKRGWTNEAFVNFQNAIRLDPNNLEYRQAYERVAGQMNGGFYGRRSGGFGGFGGGGAGGYNNGSPDGCNGCDICTSLMCADCLCQGLGGC